MIDELLKVFKKKHLISGGGRQGSYGARKL